MRIVRNMKYQVGGIVKFTSFVFTIILTLTCVFSVCYAETSEELYKIGAGDLLDIQVLDNPEFSGPAKVAMDGNINLPYIGSLRVSNINLEDIRDLITKTLSDGYIKFPVVSVSLMQSSSKNIYAYGYFRRIGQFPYEENITVIKALSIFSGVSDNGMFGKLIIKRMHDGHYKNIAEVKINYGLLMDSAVEEIILEPDDILLVERNDTILLQGEIGKKGMMILENNMTLVNALLQAGGATTNGKYGILKIRRKQEGTEEYKDIVEVKLNNGVIINSEVEETVLMPDDILLIEPNETILLQGRIAQRGRMVLENNMTVLSALVHAGGASEAGAYGVLKIRRKEEGGEEYKDIAETMLNDGVLKSSEVEQLVLQHDDILIVERNKQFYIYGEVNSTGQFSLSNEMTVFKALIVAGGFTKWGSSGNVKILRQGDDKSEGVKVIKVDVEDVIEGDASKDVYIQEGDVVVVTTGLF